MSLSIYLIGFLLSALLEVYPLRIIEVPTVDINVPVPIVSFKVGTPSSYYLLTYSTGTLTSHLTCKSDHISSNKSTYFDESSSSTYAQIGCDYEHCQCDSNSQQCGYYCMSMELTPYSETMITKNMDINGICYESIEYYNDIPIYGPFFMESTGFAHTDNIKLSMLTCDYSSFHHMDGSLAAAFNKDGNPNLFYQSYIKSHELVNFVGVCSGNFPQGGVITFGGYNPEYLTSELINWQKLKGDDLYMFEIDKIEANGHQYNRKMPYTFIYDSSSVLNLFPPSIAGKLIGHFFKICGQQNYQCFMKKNIFFIKNHALPTFLLNDPITLFMDNEVVLSIDAENLFFEVSEDIWMAAFMKTQYYANDKDEPKKGFYSDYNHNNNEDDFHEDDEDDDDDDWHEDDDDYEDDDDHEDDDDDDDDDNDDSQKSGTQFDLQVKNFLYNSIDLFSKHQDLIGQDFQLLIIGSTATRGKYVLMDNENKSIAFPEAICPARSQEDLSIIREYFLGELGVNSESFQNDGHNLKTDYAVLIIAIFAILCAFLTIIYSITYFIFQKKGKSTKVKFGSIYFVK